jgi:hypothetical protein
MDRLSELARVGFPVKYARIARWELDQNGSFRAFLALYHSEEARRADEGNRATFIIGGALTEEDAALVKTSDDRDVLYRLIEREIHRGKRQRDSSAMSGAAYASQTGGWA